MLEEFLGNDGMSKPTPDQWADFTSRLHYIHGDVTSAEDIEEVKRKLADIEGEGNGGNRLYYLSLAPSLYQPAITGLGNAGMAEDNDGWRRLVVEKPFGTDLASARELNDIAHSVFRETRSFASTLPGQGNGAESAGVPLRQRHL